MNKATKFLFHANGMKLRQKQGGGFQLPCMLQNGVTIAQR
jgi:hypothetical protein